MTETRANDPVTSGHSPAEACGGRVVLVVSPHAGRFRDHGRVRDLLSTAGLQVIETLPVDEVERIARWRTVPEEEPPLVVAAGGDGTLGAVANVLAGSEVPLAILPLGTNNDTARSLGIPLDPEDAARLLTTGRLERVDAGYFQPAEGEGRYFVQAATLGINVTFARLATNASFRQRLGRLTYLAAGILALREHQTFTCTITTEDAEERLDLIYLAIINAPVFGGPLGLTLPGADMTNRRLDVLAVEDRSLPHLLLVLVPLFLHRRLPLHTLHLLSGREIRVHSDRPLAVALDGEVQGKVPGTFTLSAASICVVVPPAGG